MNDLAMIISYFQVQALNESADESQITFNIKCRVEC